MSTEKVNKGSKVFNSFCTDLQSFSKVCNKLDFDQLVFDLITDNATGNFDLFDILKDKAKRYAFLSFAVLQVHYKGGTFKTDKTSEAKVVRFVQVLFTLNQNPTTVKLRDGKDATGKRKSIDAAQIGWKNLIDLWKKASKKKQVTTVVSV
jgi:hypothetical protein